MAWSFARYLLIASRLLELVLQEVEPTKRLKGDLTWWQNNMERGSKHSTHCLVSLNGTLTPK